MPKFHCQHCQYSKSVPEHFLGKKAKCPKCGIASEILERLAKSPQRTFPSFDRGPESIDDMLPVVSKGGPVHSRTPSHRKRWYSSTAIVVASVFFVSLLNAGLLYGMFQLQGALRTDQSVAYPLNKFSHASDLGSDFSLEASYPFRRLHIPSNLEKYGDSIPQNNRTIDISVLKSGKPVEQTAGLFNIDGRPESLSCRSSDSSIATASVTGGDSIVISPTGKGTATIFVKFMEKEFGIDFEFVETPVVLKTYPDSQTKQELIEKMGFPDSKERVFPLLSGSLVVSGFHHENSGSYEHWRYDKYPGLFVVVSGYGDQVIGLGNEH